MSEIALRTEAIAASPIGIIVPEFGQAALAHERIAALRSARAETLEAFGKLVGVGSKGRMSEIERGVQTPTAEQALAIEDLSGGMIDASALNPIVAKARGVEWVLDHGATDTPDMEAVSPGKCGDNFPAGDPHQMPGRALSHSDARGGEGLAPAGTSGGSAGRALRYSANAGQGVEASAADPAKAGGSGASCDDIGAAA